MIQHKIHDIKYTQYTVRKYCNLSEMTGSWRNDSLPDPTWPASLLLSVSVVHFCTPSYVILPTCCHRLAINLVNLNFNLCICPLSCSDRAWRAFILQGNVEAVVSLVLHYFRDIVCQKPQRRVWICQSYVVYEILLLFFSGHGV